MVISYTFTFRLDPIMRNYTVYDALTNWKLREKAKMAAGLLMVLAAPSTEKRGGERQHGDSPRRGVISPQNKPLYTLLSWSIYISIRFVACLGLLRRIPRGKQVGSFGFFFKACSGYHGVFAPEVTVEFFHLDESQNRPN